MKALSGKRILILDDEPDVTELISYKLKREGCVVEMINNPLQIIGSAREFKPDLFILDIMMPKKTGVEVCNILRSQSLFQDTIIIFLTALSDEESQIKGLETGADDYISKPISPKVLISRVNALFRRFNKENGKTINVGNVSIDPVKFSVTVDNKIIILAKKEFELLRLLASKPGRVFLRNEILTQIWGTDVIVGDRTIDVHIRKIRQKLELDCITTVKGVGYKFEL